MMIYKDKKIFLFLSFAAIFSLSLFADTSYKVNKGDTLYSISKKYQITVAELRAANNLSEKDIIKAGQKLIIPDADIGTAAALSTSKSNKETDNQTSSEECTEITVKKGDTLYSISREYGISVADLLSINNLDSAVIKIGQKIKVKKSENKNTSSNQKNDNKYTSKEISEQKTPDTRNYGTTLISDSGTKWPVKNPKITQIKGKISGVQLSAQKNESVTCIHEGTVMYVGTYRGFGQVVFIQSKTGLIYAYTGLGSVSVKKGEYILSSHEIGKAGQDSISGNSQITFMVFQNGQPIDPASAPRN